MKFTVTNFSDCSTPEEILSRLLYLIKFHNDGDTNVLEFAETVGILTKQAEDALEVMNEPVEWERV